VPNAFSVADAVELLKYALTKYEEPLFMRVALTASASAGQQVGKIVNLAASDLSFERGWHQFEHAFQCLGRSFPLSHIDLPVVSRNVSVRRGAAAALGCVGTSAEIRAPARMQFRTQTRKFALPRHPLFNASKR
jgi:hypothetical protein